MGRGDVAWCTWRCGQNLVLSFEGVASPCRRCSCWGEESGKANGRGIAVYILEVSSWFAMSYMLVYVTLSGVVRGLY